MNIENLKQKQKQIFRLYITKIIELKERKTGKED